MKTLTVGVLGAGRIGKLHIENILKYFPQIKLKAVSDPFCNEEWFQTLNGIKHPEAYLTTDANKIFKDKEIDAVLIASPSPLHAEQIISAARAGKHIFCEKPISMDVESIEKSLHAVKNANVKLQVGFNRRFDPNFAKVKEMLNGQQIGDPHLLRITSRDPQIPPADYIGSSSGIFLDMTIHDFDMARFLMGCDIQEVYAMGNVLIDPIFKDYNDVDTAVINLKFANGSLGVIDNSRQAAYGYDQRVEVFGSCGAVQAENNKTTNTICSTKDGVMSEKPLHFFVERYKESYIAELQSFYQCVMNDTPPAVSGRDGLYSVLIGLAAQQSLQENRPVAIDYEKWLEM